MDAWSNETDPEKKTEKEIEKNSAVQTANEKRQKFSDAQTALTDAETVLSNAETEKSKNRKRKCRGCI